MAKAAKWTQKPIDAAEITALAASFSEIAERYCTDDFYGRELVERAVRYIDEAHGQPMGDNPDWFEYMLRALLEVARPNCRRRSETLSIVR